MSDGVQIDVTEETKLAADLGDVPKNIGPFLKSAVQFTSQLIKADAREAVASGQKSWKVAARAIGYETKTAAGAGGSSITAEIGYDKNKPGGALGNLREFGAPNAPSVVFTKVDGKTTVIPLAGTSAPRPPHNDLRTALAKNQDDFEKGIDKAVEDALAKAGL